MTSSKLDTCPVSLVKAGGVRARAPLALYVPGNPAQLVVLALYGAPQQVRAIMAMLATGTPVTLVAPQGAERPLLRPDQLRVRGWPVGHGYQGMLLWDEALPQTHVVWATPDERAARFRDAISRRTIPVDPAWLPELERVLVEQKQLLPLEGWGGGGYLARWDDNAVCTLLIERYGSKPAKANQSNRRRPRSKGPVAGRAA